MELYEYQKGIYSLPENPSVSSQTPLVIAVHPFFLSSLIDKEYIRRRDNFFRSTEGKAFLLFEEEIFFDENLENLLRVCKGNIENKFLVKTEFEDPTPSELDWEEVFTFASRFKQPLVFMGGAYYEGKRKGESYWEGCLAYTYQRFLEAGFDGEINRSLTFSKLGKTHIKLK